MFLIKVVRSLVLVMFPVVPYALEPLYPPSEKGQEHSRLLEQYNVTRLDVDLKQMGVAGINSWVRFLLKDTG